MAEWVVIDDRGRIAKAPPGFDPTSIYDWAGVTLDLFHSDVTGLKIVAHEREVFLQRATEAQKFREALEEIAALGGPHYSETTRRALKIARVALGRDVAI